MDSLSSSTFARLSTKLCSGFDNWVSHQEILEEDFDLKNIEYKGNGETISEMMVAATPATVKDKIQRVLVFPDS